MKSTNPLRSNNNNNNNNTGFNAKLVLLTYFSVTMVSKTAHEGFN